ncbi:ferredoxin--NADP+ reductase [Motilibacter rhizosphaerae]|uniref:ferredoxin--NADP(+) reductase n=1 Tax=Motilibacter rhizosphaerae TaxID=598652 RepID=A0A4Q7NAT8_9ACTN|nr:FAD-dependent oxidoreductase [Motilibacter rhizosphaerae]RZS80029.1 ferredoxin--NADP+ reductase [Motilibacter rhizosphaerae]
MLRVAIVGSGPAGIYAAESLAAHAPDLPDGIAVDVLDRLPCPYGLVRYGVAPDHEKIRSIATALARTFAQPGVRFLGNVGVGEPGGVSTEQLRAGYDAVVYAYGAAQGKHLGIPGDGLAGSFTATEFVSWYCGHPDTRLDAFTCKARTVAVVGMGNVAVDVARILLKPGAELARTDVPPHVLEALERSPVEVVHVVGRRGPGDAKWTTKELRELGDLHDVDVLVEPRDVDLSAADDHPDPHVRRNLAVVREWAAREPGGRPRKLVVHFGAPPQELLGTTVVEGLRTPSGVLDVEMVVASVGYTGTPLTGLPFDVEHGVVPNEAGRILRDGAASPGEYVAGWIKRGPTGVVGTNKHDAHETVAALLEDAAAGRLPARTGGDVLELLPAGSVVTWAGWDAIEQAERALGEQLGRQRAKIVARDELLAAARRAD